MITVLQIAVGVIVLLAGRRLFWMFVAAVGFGIAFALSARLLVGWSEWAIVLIALLVGTIGAVLAVLVQQAAIGLAGFLAGGYGLVAMLQIFQLKWSVPEWLFFVIGGIVGAVLVAVIFDWALILLSSILGSSLVAQSIDLPLTLNAAVMFVLILVGISYQASALRKEVSSPVAKIENREED